MDESELNILDSTYPPASVLAINEIPPDYGNYRIVQVAIKFMYDDGSNDNKGVHCNVASGQSVTVIATNQGCCRSYFCLMQVRVPGGSTQVVTNSTNVDDNYCGGQVTWHLGISKTIKKGSTTNGEHQLELILK